MKRTKLLSVLFLCLGFSMTANGIWMLVSSTSWFALLPAALEDTGELNNHFAHDVGLAYLTFGLGMIWCSRHIQQSRVVFLGVTLFTVGHALSHVGEMLYGQLPAAQWYIDFPLVFLPAIILGTIALPPGGYDVRIFAPGQELEFAGHPSLGTAYILQKHVIAQPAQKVVLNLKVGQISVSFPNGADETVWMEQIAPTFGTIVTIAAVLSLKVVAIDTRFPVQEVSTGFPHFIVPLRSLDFLQAATIDKQRYFELVGRTGVSNILLFSRESYSPGQRLSARMFADALGIPEDPATGSGNGCLAGYLVKHRYLQSESIDIKVGQGYEIGRPSSLSLRARKKDEGIAVAVGGKVVPVAEGFWG